MVKKILTLLILITFITPATLARVGTPAFTFSVDNYFTDPAVENNGQKKNDGGLSGGAVTAITLGSIGGAALLGLGGWLYKRKAEQSLTAGCIRGVQNPLLPFCMEKNPNSEIYARINNNYPYLKKALSLNEIHYCPDSKYLLIYDTEIQKRKFDSVKFEIPQGTKELKITQVTDPFNPKDLTVELYLYKNKTTEPELVQLKALRDETNNGIIIKSLNADFRNYGTADYVVSNYSDKKIYAVVIEFIFR